MGRNLGDIRVWRDLGSGLGKDGDIKFDEREFTTRRAMQGIVFPETETDEGSIVPQGTAADKNWTYFWHLEGDTDSASDERELLRSRGWTLATTEYFKPNREYYRVIGNKIYWGRKACYVLPEERLLENEKEDRSMHNKIMGQLDDTSSIQRAADNVSIKSRAFDNVRAADPVKPRSRR